MGIQDVLYHGYTGCFSAPFSVPSISHMADKGDAHFEIRFIKLILQKILKIILWNKKKLIIVSKPVNHERKNTLSHILKHISYSPLGLLIFIYPQGALTVSDSALTVSTTGQRKPAPTLAWMSTIGRVKSLGTPALSSSWLRNRWVLAIQTGKLANPFKKETNH